jgi:hypothetical protein
MNKLITVLLATVAFVSTAQAQAPTYADVLRTCGAEWKESDARKTVQKGECGVAEVQGGMRDAQGLRVQAQSADASGLSARPRQELERRFKGVRSDPSAFGEQFRSGVRPMAKTKMQGAVIGRNVTVTAEGNVIVIRVDSEAEGVESKSGKSVVIGTTNGNVEIPGLGLKIGLNVYRPV